MINKRRIKMPYISSEDMKSIRDTLKKEFPGFKLSVRKIHHSTVSVTILRGNVDFNLGDKKYQAVNPYHYQSHFEGQALQVISQIFAIIKGTKEQTFHDDSDYGSIPSFYIDISIGSWDKPYELVK